MNGWKIAAHADFSGVKVIACVYSFVKFLTLHAVIKVICDLNYASKLSQKLPLTFP